MAGGCLALVLAAMAGCTDSGQEPREAVPVRPGTQRSALSLGTPELVADIQPTPPPSKLAGSDPQGFVRVGAMLYFTAYDPVHGRELCCWHGGRCVGPPPAGAESSCRPVRQERGPEQ
ncbi:hypothetical protein [Archangium sp.]|uniref:hypothetical protein n=1 Tax=Archangium sp. TaxID=1872627 RepID=UPI002ED7EAB0